MAYGDNDEEREDKLDQEAEDREPTDLIAKMAEIEGDVSDVLDEGERGEIAARAVEEWGFDRNARRGWEETIDRALAAARQDDSKKAFPWENAANFKFPVLTTAVIQFGSRTYGALVRDEQVVKSKVFGADPQGIKAAQGQRVTQFANYQLLHQCDEWDPGTDALCHQIPLVGKAFRKLFWNKARNRPTIDLVSAKHVYVPMDAPSLDQAPRVTQRCSYYPFEIAQRIASGRWREHDYECARDGQDSQAPIEYIEQYRYEDLDRDGLPEPYVATVLPHTNTLVHLEPAFDPQHLRVWESGAGDALVRDLPWIDYDFLPNPDGGYYSWGFGHLAEALQAAINAILNQIVDAGTRANAGGGFISQELKLRGKTVRIRPGHYEPVNVAGPINQAIHEVQGPGPNPTQFAVLEMLLGAADKVLGSPDVLSGDMPNQQHVAEGTILALIEQGLTVYATIYKRLYRSERRAHRRLFGLNRDFLDPAVYQQVLDIEGADPRTDFDMRGVDVLPISDPGQITDMQKIARGNFLASRVAANPIEYNATAVERRILEAARIENIDEILNPPDSPIRQMAMRKATAEIQKLESDARASEAKAADNFQKAQEGALERGVREGELRAVAEGSGDAEVLPGAEGNGRGGEGAPRGNGVGGAQPQ